MDRFFNMITNIEQAIRYLLSGIVVCAIYIGSIRDVTQGIEWIRSNALLSLFISGAVGFTVYSIYRILFNVIGDGIAWHANISAPALEKNRPDENNEPISYATAYSRFLLWRRNKDFDESLNGYLHYRWALVHFCFITSIALFIALLLKHNESLIASHCCLFLFLATFCFFCSLLQCKHLFMVEKELYRMHAVGHSGLQSKQK